MDVTYRNLSGFLSGSSYFLTGDSPIGHTYLDHVFDIFGLKSKERLVAMDLVWPANPNMEGHFLDTVFLGPDSDEEIDFDGFEDADLQNSYSVLLEKQRFLEERDGELSDFSSFGSPSDPESDDDFSLADYQPLGRRRRYVTADSDEDFPVADLMPLARIQDRNQPDSEMDADFAVADLMPLARLQDRNQPDFEMDEAGGDEE